MNNENERYVEELDKIVGVIDVRPLLDSFGRIVETVDISSFSEYFKELDRVIGLIDVKPLSEFNSSLYQKNC